MTVVRLASPLLILLACQNGSVPTYAPCAATDTCPSSTKCEASATGGATFCTKSCTTSNDCPNDDTGAQGICSSDVGPSATAAPFCYEACPTNGCPLGGTCVSVVATDTSIVTACLPGLTSPLSATSWTSTTLAPAATTKGVATSTYAIKFATGEFSPDTITVTGAFSATLTQGFNASSLYVGCTETTTFTGGTWMSTAQPSFTMGRIAVTGAIGSTNRTGCTDTTKNATNLANVYDAAVNQGVGDPFNAQGTTLTITSGGGGGGLPYGDKVDWTFTKS